MKESRHLRREYRMARGLVTVMRASFRPVLLMALIVVVGCAMLAPHAEAAAGDIIWASTRNPNPGPGNDARAQDVAVDGSGVYVAGYYDDGTNNVWRIEKLAPADGTSLWVTTRNPNPGNDARAEGVAVDGSGVYVAGGYSDGTNYVWRVEKLALTDGSSIWVSTRNPNPGHNAYARDVAVDGSGVYVAGEYYDGINDVWRVEKLARTDGSSLWVSTRNLNPGQDSAAWGIAVDGSGVYVAGGYSDGTNWVSRVEKLALTDGSSLWVTTRNPNPGHNADAWRVAVDGSGVYVAGDYDDGTNYVWRVEKLARTDGSSLWVTTRNPNPGPGHDCYATDVAVDGSGVYAGGHYNDGTNFVWRVEKLALGDGSSVWVRTSNPNPGQPAFVTGVAVDGSGVYVAGDYDDGTNYVWRVEKRQTGLVSVTVTSNPEAVLGLVRVDGADITAPHTYTWLEGSTHTLEALEPETAGTRYVFTDWSDGGGQSHIYTVPATSAIVTATFGIQYYLTMQANPSAGGSASPNSDWHDAGSTVTIQATPASNYAFSSWSGSGDGSYSGTSSSATVTMNAPITETANFESVTPPGPCAAAAAFGSSMAVEVVYMRHVRDEQIGSTPVGAALRNGWNTFYYAWSPPLAHAIAGSELSRGVFRVLLVPLLGIVYLAGATFGALSWAGDIASIVAFAVAATLSTTTYIIAPVLAFRAAVKWRRRKA